MCRAQNVQSCTNSATRCSLCFSNPLLTGLYLLCHDCLHCYPKSGNLYAYLCVYLFAVALHQRYFMARSSCSLFLEIRFVAVPVYFRHQRICTHQQYGGYFAGSTFRVPGTLVANRRLLPYHLLGISPSNLTEQKTCTGSFA